MSNLFDILKFRQEKSIQDRSGHTQAKGNNVIVHDRLSKSESLDATESVGVHDRRKRRSTSSENAEVTIEDEAVQGGQRDHHGDDKVFELESLKQFTIPKKKKSKKELLESISITSREFQQDILPVIKQGYKDRNADRNYNYTSVQLVHNKDLLYRYQEKRKELRGLGYSEKEVSDSYAYYCVDTFWEAKGICEDGFEVGNVTTSCLGNPKLAVCLSRHADVIRPMGMYTGYTGRLLVCKIIKGKVKAMVENRGEVQLDPTPNFDCHVSKTANVDMWAAGPLQGYESTQIFLYEYDDLLEIEKKPRQVYPFAVVCFTYTGPTRLQKTAPAPNPSRIQSGGNRLDPRTVQPMQRPVPTDPRFDARLAAEIGGSADLRDMRDPGMNLEPRESKLKDLRLTGNPRDPRLSTSDPRTYRRSVMSPTDQRPEPQAAAWDPVASAKPPSSGGAVPLLMQKGHGSGAFKSGFGRPSAASASGKPSPVSAAKPSSGSTKSPSGGSSGYSSSGKPSPVSSAGGPPSPFTKPVASPALGKPQGSPGSRRRYSGSAQSKGKPVSPGTAKPSSAVTQSHLEDAGDAGITSERVGGEVAYGGCVVWEGELVSKSVDLCRVNMIAFGTSLKPARIGIKLNIATRVPIESLGDKLMSCVIGLCRDAETRVGMKYYNYCELQPASEVDNDRFFQLISYLTGNQSASVIKLEVDTDLVILPPCEKSLSLGLTRDYHEMNVLHCIFISSNSRHLQHQGKARGSVSEPSSPATPLGPYNRTPQTSPGASGGSVHSPANSHPGSHQAALSPSGYAGQQNSPHGTQQVQPGFPVGSPQGQMFPSPNQHPEYMGRSTTLASGAGDPWGTQSTPNDLASVKLLPLDGSGEDTSVQDETVFKEPPQPARVVKDSSVDVLYDNGFKQHIPVESLIFRDTIVQAFKQQETSQDQRNQEMARKSKQARAAAKGIPSLEGKPVMSLSNKPPGSAGSGKSMTSPASSKPMLSPQTQSPMSPLAGMENIFKGQTNQDTLTDGYPSASGMMPGRLAQQGRQQMPPTSADYNRQLGIKAGPLMSQGEMLSPTQSELQQQMAIGHAPQGGMLMTDINEPPYAQHFGQQQPPPPPPPPPPQPESQQPYYHQQPMQQNQQYPYQQQQQYGQNTYDQQMMYQQQMGYQQHNMPGMHVSPPAKAISNDPRLLKRQSHQQHLLQQGGLPPGSPQVSPPVSESLLRRHLTVGGSSNTLHHSAMAATSMNAANSSLSPNLYSTSSYHSAEMNTAPLPLDNFSGDLQGLHDTSQQQQFSQQQQAAPQLQLQDPPFSGQNFLPKSLSVGPTPGTQESSPTPGIISSQASGVTKPRPTEGLTTDPQALKPGAGDKRGLVTTGTESSTAVASGIEPFKLLDTNILDITPGTKSVEELERELEELKRLSEKTEQDIEAFNIKAKKRIERGNSTDSMLSTESEKSHDQIKEASSYLNRAKQVLNGEGELTDDLVDAIVKRPVVKTPRRSKEQSSDSESTEKENEKGGPQLCDIDFSVPTSVKRKAAYVPRGRTPVKKFVPEEQGNSDEKVDAIIAESAQEMRAMLEETIAGEEPYSPEDRSEAETEGSSGKRGLKKDKPAVPKKNAAQDESEKQNSGDSKTPDETKDKATGSKSPDVAMQSSLLNTEVQPRPASPKTPMTPQDQPASSLMESPESPPQDQSPAPEGHLLLDRPPVKQPWPSSFVNAKNGIDAASWPAAFVNNDSAVAWATPGLVGGAAGKQEAAKSQVSHEKPSPDTSDQENQENKSVKATTDVDTTVSESEATFKVPREVKMLKRLRRKDGGTSGTSREDDDESANETSGNLRGMAKPVRIPADPKAVKKINEFVAERDLDNTTVMSRAALELERGECSVTSGLVELGSGPHDVSVTIDNNIIESNEDDLTADNAICKAMCLALHRKDPDELQEVTLGERDWIQWWMWALHYALWNMDATDEAIAREQEDKENTTATLTRKEGDTRIFWLRPQKSGDKVTIKDERTLCVSDSSALCLPEGTDTELSVSLSRSLSEEWRISSSCARCGPVQVRCQCRNDDQPTHDNLLESPSRVQSPFVGQKSPPICLPSVAGDPVDSSDCDDDIHITATSDPDDKWWHYLSRPNNGKADKFAIRFTVEALSAALDQIPTKESSPELGNNGSALPVPNASDKECTSEFPLPKRDAVWTTIYDIMNDLRESSTNVGRDTQTDDSDYESSDDSFKMSETLSDISSAKLIQAQKGRRARGSRRVGSESTGCTRLFESDAFSSGDESADSGAGSMPPSRPGCLNESVQWTDQDRKQIENILGDRTKEDHLEDSRGSLAETRISPLSPTFHRKLVESLESLAECQANSGRESANVENGSESQKTTTPKTEKNGKTVASRKLLDEILSVSEISPPPQIVQVYHVTASPAQSPKSPESSTESPPPPASPTESPPNPTSPSDSQPVSPEGTAESVAGPSRDVNAGAPEASASSSKASTPIENGAGGDSKEKDPEKHKESKREGEKSRDKEGSSHKERKHETEEERRLRKLHKEKKKKKKKKHEHDRDKDREKSKSDKHERSKDKDKDRDKDRDRHKDKDRDKDRDKDKERRRKEEKERERAKKDKDRKREHSSSRSSHKTESIKQLGNILSELPVTVTSDAKATASTAGVKQEEEMVIDLGDQFIVEDAQLAWGKDMAKIVAVAPTRRVVSVVAVDSSEDEKEAKKSEPKKDKPSEDKKSEKFITETEIKKEPFDKSSTKPESTNNLDKPSESVAIKKEDQKESQDETIVSVKKEVDASATEKKDEMMPLSETEIKKEKPENENEAKSDTLESKKIDDVGGKSQENELKKESEGSDEKKKKERRGIYKFTIKTRGLVLRAPVHAHKLFRKFKVKISRKEKKRANKAGNRGRILYTSEIRHDVESKRSKYSRRMSSEKKEVKKERRAVILDDDSDEDIPPVKREPEVKEVKDERPTQERKPIQDLTMKKEHQAEEKDKSSSSSSWAKALVEKYKNEDRKKRLMLEAKRKAMAMSAHKKRVDDFIAHRLFKRYEGRYRLKECSVAISHKERRRAEKRQKRLEGTAYLKKIMRECKLAREREREGAPGLKRPGDPQDTSQPKRMKTTWSGMPSFKIPKGDRDNDGFRVPKARDPNEERRRMEEMRRRDDEKENEEMDIEEGFFTEEELKAKERVHTEKKKESEKKANEEELMKEAAHMRKEWRKNVLRRVKRTGVIVFEIRGRRDEHKFKAYTLPPQEEQAKLKITDPRYKQYKQHRNNQEILTMLTHEGSRRRIFPHGLPPPLGNDKRFKDYKFKRNIVEIMSKADEEDIPWEFKPTNLDEKLKRLDELEREKQEEHALDVDDLQQLYGQADDDPTMDGGPGRNGTERVNEDIPPSKTTVETDAVENAEEQQPVENYSTKKLVQESFGDSTTKTPEKTAAQQALEQSGTVIRAENGFVIVTTPLEENTDSPGSLTASSTMGKKGKKKRKWPGMNYEVDVPKQHIAYKAGKDADLPAVLEKEIVSELDPRLESDLPETSVYKNVGKFFEDLIIAEKEAAAKAQKEAEKPPSEQSSEEESWYKTDVTLPAGVSDLKVSVQGAGSGKTLHNVTDKIQNYPPAFPPAAPSIPVIPQTIQQVPRAKDVQPDPDPVKPTNVSAEPKTAETPKAVAPTSLPIPRPTHGESAKTAEEPSKNSERQSREAENQDSAKLGDEKEKEKKKAYGKRRGHKTVIPEDKVNSWITASEPFFSQDLSPEPLPEPVMPLLVPKPVIAPALQSSSNTEAGGDDRKTRNKSPEKSSSTEKHHRSSSSRRSKSSTSSRDRDKGSKDKKDTDKNEKPDSGDEGEKESQSREPEKTSAGERKSAQKEGSDKDGSESRSFTQESILKTTESGKLVLPKELEDSITEFLQKKFKMSLSEVKSKSDDKDAEKERAPKAMLKPKQEKRDSSPDVEIIEQEEKRTIKVTPAPPPPPQPVPPPEPVLQKKSPVKPTPPKSQKGETQASAISALHVEASGKRQVLLPRALREKQKGSEPPPAPPVPPLPSRDRRRDHSPDKTSPQRRLPPPPDRRLPPPPPPEQRRLPPPPPLDKVGERTQQSVQDVFREFIKQEKELLGKENIKAESLRRQSDKTSSSDMQNELSRGLDAVIASSGVRVKHEREVGSSQKRSRNKTGNMEDELRENLSAAMEQAVNDIGLQGKTRREKHVNDINILQEGLSAQMDSIIQDSFRSEQGKQKKPGWFSTTKPLFPFSKYARKTLRAVCGKASNQVDDLVETKCSDIQLGLDSIFRGKDVDLDDLDLGDGFKHLPGLSLGTQLESTFAESSVVKRLHLETLRDWQKEKPLDMLLMGKLDLTTINPGKIKPSPKTDETVRQCMEEFREEIFKVMRGGEVPTDDSALFPKPRCQTEETVNQVHRQVSKYLDFLEEQARTTPYAPLPPGSKKKKKHKKHKKRKSRTTESDDEQSAERSAASSLEGTDSDEEGEIKTSSAEEGELDENSNAERRARKRTKKVRRLSKDASDSDDESPEKKPKKHKKKKKHKDSAKKRRKATEKVRSESPPTKSNRKRKLDDRYAEVEAEMIFQATQNKEPSPVVPNKDDNLVSYGAVLAKRQRLMAEPKGVPPPQGVSAPEPIRQDSQKGSATNKQKTAVSQKKDGPPAVGMYSPTRPTDETKDKQDDTPENAEANFEEMLTKVKKLANRSRSTSEGQRAQLSSVNRSRDPRLDPAKKIPPTKPVLPTKPPNETKPDKDPAAVVSHGAALNPYNVWWVVMKYFLEQEPNALEFLDNSWPELDRFQFNKEPQNSFLWALAQARHHRRSGFTGKPKPLTKVDSSGKLPSENKESGENCDKGSAQLLEVDIPTATIEITGDENEYGSSGAVPTTPVEAVNAEILASTSETEVVVEEDKKEKEGEEVADSAADLLAKTKSAKSAIKKSNALTLAFKQALMAKKGPTNTNAASNKDIEKFLEKVKCVLNEKIRCDQKGEVSLMRDTDVKNPHLQALSFRAKGLLKMARHNLMQVPGPSEKLKGLKPVAVVQPASSTPSSSAPSSTTPATSVTPAETSSVQTVTVTVQPTVSTAKPKTPIADTSSDKFDRLQAAIKQHEEAIKRLEEERVANTAAALLAKIRKKSEPTELEQSLPATDGTDISQSKLGTPVVAEQPVVPANTAPAVSTVGSAQEPGPQPPPKEIQPTHVPTPAQPASVESSVQQPIVIEPQVVEQQTAKDDPTSKKQPNVLKNLSKFSKMNIPQDQATKSTAAALLAKVKAKKTGGESPSSNQPTAEAEPLKIPVLGEGGVAMVNEWPPTQDQAQIEVQSTSTNRVEEETVTAPMPPAEEKPPPPPEPEPEAESSNMVDIDTEDSSVTPADATSSAPEVISTIPTISAQPQPPQPPSSSALSSISGAPVSYPVPAPPLPPMLSQPSSTQGYMATSQPAITAQTATSVATSEAQHGWTQSQQSWFQNMSQNMDATQWQQWQQWANSHGYQWPGYQQQGPPDPSAWQKAFENLSKVVGEEKPAWWSGPWPPHPNQHPHQQWPPPHPQWGHQGAWGDPTGGWQQGGGWGSGWGSYDQSQDPSAYSQQQCQYEEYDTGPPGVMGQGQYDSGPPGVMPEDNSMYEDEPPPPGQENMPAFSTGMSSAPKPPPQHFRRGANSNFPKPPAHNSNFSKPPAPHVPSLLHDIDVSKPPPPFVPHGHDIQGGLGRGKASGRGRGRGNSPTSVKANPWEGRGRGRGAKESPPAMVSPWDAAKGGISVEKLNEMQAAQAGGNSAAEPEERVEPLGLNVKIYILNGDAPLCRSVEDFLQFNGIKKFDPFNLAALQHNYDPEAIVFIHNTHIDQIHRIPNLLELRQQPWVKFATFNDVFDIKHRTYKIILKKGGCIVPDDTALLSLNAETLDQIGTFMVQQREKLTPWSIKIHEHVMDRLRSSAMQKGEDKERFQVLLLLVEKFMRQGVVQVLPAEKFPGGPRPPHQYHSTLQQLQIENCLNYRHFLLLSEVPCSDTRFQGILDGGFGIVDISSFMQLIIDKQAGRQVFVANPVYGLKESELFWDADLTSATDSLFKHDPNLGD